MQPQSQSIAPVAKALFLCRTHVGYAHGEVDLYNLFNVINAQSFPHTEPQINVVAQLTGGMGTVDFFVDVRFASTRQLIRPTLTRQIRFASRTVLVWLVLGIQGCTFDQPGLYLFELFCNNQWVCDTTLTIR